MAKIKAIKLTEEERAALETGWKKAGNRDPPMPSVSAAR